MRYAFVIVACLLAGCASVEERIAAQASTCQKMGYKPDTDAFRGCQISLYQAEQQTSAAILSNRPKTCSPNGAGGVVCN